MIKKAALIFAIVSCLCSNAFSQRTAKPYPASIKFTDNEFIGMTINSFIQYIKQGDGDNILRTLYNDNNKTKYKSFQNKIKQNKDIYYDIEIGTIKTVNVKTDKAIAEVLLIRKTDKNKKTRLFFKLIKTQGLWKIANNDEIIKDMENNIYPNSMIKK